MHRKWKDQLFIFSQITYYPPQWQTAFNLCKVNCLAINQKISITPLPEPLVWEGEKRDCNMQLYSSVKNLRKPMTVFLFSQALISHLPVASFQWQPALRAAAGERPWDCPPGTLTGTSRSPAAAECAETRSLWPALKTNKHIINSWQTNWWSYSHRKHHADTKWPSTLAEVLRTYTCHPTTMTETGGCK